MSEVTTKTQTTQGDATKPIVIPPVKIVATSSQTIEYVIYFILGTLEILLGFRLVLKLMGASLASGFVRIVYMLSSIFVLPFEGIFRKGFTQGLETTSVIEPSTIVAMVVYAVIVWGIVKFVRISSGEKQSTE